MAKDNFEKTITKILKNKDSVFRLPFYQLIFHL